MKVVERQIYPYQEVILFSPIRDKVNYVRVLAQVARILLLNIEENVDYSKPFLRLVVDKMSRVFIYKDEKYYSISFPFSILSNNNKVEEMNSYTGKKVDNKAISAVFAILESKEFQLNPSLIDFYIEPNSIDQTGVFLLEEMFQFEPSYIRYDFDKANAKGKLHPLHHLDINYSQYSTYKLGLHNHITDAYFENLQNINTNCSFVVD